MDNVKTSAMLSVSQETQGTIAKSVVFQILSSALVWSATSIIDTI